MEIAIEARQKMNRLQDFLNSLPDSSGYQVWLQEFRNGLKQLLFDVDRIVLSIDLTAEHIPYDNRPINGSIMYSKNSESDFAKFASREIHQGLSRSMRVVMTLSEWGFDFSEYHTPLVQEYIQGNDYLGTLIFLRSRQNAFISNETMATIVRMHPFITYMLSNCILRSRIEFPESRIVRSIIGKFIVKSKYTDQDLSVLTQLLYGYSYKEAADALGISIDTVKKHVKRIYSRENVGSLSELWAKYIKLRVDDEPLLQKSAGNPQAQGTQRGTVSRSRGSLPLP